MCVNDTLDTVPDLLSLFTDLLARFRLRKYGFMAVITKCFFQIGVPLKQQDIFCILWFWNDDTDGKMMMVKYQFTRHPFGIKGSAFAAILCYPKVFLK